MRTAALVLLAASLGACSSFNLFGKKDDTPPDEPADKLYNEGLYLPERQAAMRARPSRNSRKSTVSIRIRNGRASRSSWRRTPITRPANTTTAITAAKRYVTLHPGSPDAAYAQYLIGASYYDEIPDVTRDQERTEKAMAALDEVIRKYPTSEYAISAKQKARSRARPARRQGNGDRPLLSEQEGLHRRHQPLQSGRHQYQTTRHVEEALMRLTEAYMALGIVEEAQTAAAVLGHNFPDSDWYKHAYALVKTGGVEPSENKGSWISKAFKKVGLG